MNHFLAKEWSKVQAQKRGGGQRVLSFDSESGEQRLAMDRADHMTPDRKFDREWATALLDKVLNLLEEDYRREGKGELFESLKQTLAGSRETQPYARLAVELSMNEGAVKTAVHRLRKRYRQLLEAEIANTVASAEEIKEELSYLLAVISDR
jgi:RNA polymerase sigma-70 factor (ECF subfamily)